MQTAGGTTDRKNHILNAAKDALGLKRAVSYLPICFAKMVAPFYERKSLRKKQTLYFTPYAIAVLDSNGRVGQKRRSRRFRLFPALPSKQRPRYCDLVEKDRKKLRFNLIGKQCLMGPTRRKNESPLSRTYCAAVHPSDCYSKCSLSICSYPLLTLPIQINVCFVQSCYPLFPISLLSQQFQNINVFRFLITSVKNSNIAFDSAFSTDIRFRRLKDDPPGFIADTW